MTDKYNMTDSHWLLIFFSPDDVYCIICNYIADIILINSSFVASDVNCNLILIFLCMTEENILVMYHFVFHKLFDIWNKNTLRHMHVTLN